MQPRILVPYDFSSHAEAALRWAVELHRSCGGALKLIHLLENPLPVSYGGAVQGHMGADLSSYTTADEPDDKNAAGVEKARDSG